MRLADSRARYNILIGKKGDMLYDIEETMRKHGTRMNFDSLSLGQLESKDWAVQIMKDLQNYKPRNFGTVFVLCGWYAMLPVMMFYSGLAIDKIRSFDINEKCFEIADSMNKTNYDKGWRFKAITEDVFKIKFSGHTWQMWSNSNDRMCFPITDVPDTIINTSCEHTKPDWFKNIPRQKLVILQSNDFWDGEGHINCVNNRDEFKQMYPVKDIFYIGKLHCEKYTRFMLVGMT